MQTISGDATQRFVTNASIGLLIVAAPLAVFCWWGLFTLAGQKRYDEMDGFIPFFGGVGAALAVVLALTLQLFGWWRRRRRA